MLRRIAQELADLVADARSSAKVSFRSSFEERRDAGWMQIQIELLREILESADFAAAMHRIITFPHERLAFEALEVRTDRQLKWNASAEGNLLRVIHVATCRIHMPFVRIIISTQLLNISPTRRRNVIWIRLRTDLLSSLSRIFARLCRALQKFSNRKPAGKRSREFVVVFQVFWTNG